MRDHVSEAALAGARAYEALHVPALFQEWVEPVLEAARVQRGQAVLDVACGTGVLARGARERVGPSGSVIGVDPDPGMLGVASEIDASIDWRRGVAEALPLEDGSVDAVVSQFGMMFFRDREGAAAEMLRVLRPGGRMSVAVWDALENQPAYATEVALLDELAGKEAGDALRAPFVLGDAAQLLAVFEEAGFEDVQVESRTGVGRFPDIRTLVSADLRGWLPVMGVHLAEDTIERVLEAADREMAHLVSDGKVVFDSPAHVVSGRRRR
ncbi:MAG TPA: methyltransferase domain-containing protein [Longimicrobiales bacterium]|nr:methyltransferase domain-containing protein [Longimicrobiales bacterium]